MLALTPEPLQTAGERAFFGELARWDTGASVRAAVVASIPLVDGPLGRRQSDAVLLVPEGVAVIRVVEVLRQSGVVTATPDGAWSIAPEGGPSQVLQLVGGGSSPLDGLMRAGMDTAMKLRRAGLEPGRIARLTVLVGEISGLVPADGDLGEGDLVATLDPRSLLLAFARAGRHAGVDNPRFWTTADVRAALEALELPGRGPTVEELNGEAFPYSPYVLRRPQLLAPAAMAASPVHLAPSTEATAAGDEQPEAGTAQQLSATSVARAVAASVASANAAAVAAAAPPGPVPKLTGQRDTVEVDERPTPSASSASSASSVSSASPVPDVPAGPPRTSVLPVVSGVSAPPPQERPPLSPAWGPPPPDRDRPRAEGEGGRRWLVLAALVALAALVGAGLWLLSGSGPHEDAGGGTSAAPTAEAGPRPGDVVVVEGTSYTLEATDVADTCTGHAYGEVAGYLAENDCAGLSRALWSASAEGRPVVVSVSRVTMADPATARQLRQLADTDGSGNVSDLLREGVTFEGGPTRLSSAEYASAVSGPTVTIVESSWSDPAAAGSATAVDAVATDGLSLPTSPLPGS